MNHTSLQKTHPGTPSYSRGIIHTGISPKNHESLKREFMEKIEPYKDIFQFNKYSLKEYDLHLALRYPGHLDELSENQLNTLYKTFKELFKKLLPLEFEIEKVQGNWEFNSIKQPYVFVTFKEENLKAIHKHALAISQDFPHFPDIEGKTFKPHFTLGSIKEGRNPEEFSKIFAKLTKEFKRKIVFDRGYIYDSNKMFYLPNK